MDAVSVFHQETFSYLEPSRIAIDRMDLEKRKSKWCVEEAVRVEKGIKSPR